MPIPTIAETRVEFAPNETRSVRVVSENHFDRSANIVSRIGIYCRVHKYGIHATDTAQVVYKRFARAQLNAKSFVLCLKSRDGLCLCQKENRRRRNRLSLYKFPRWRFSLLTTFANFSSRDDRPPPFPVIINFTSVFLSLSLSCRVQRRV